MGLSMETRTFLAKLPANAMSKSVVAKVEVVSSNNEEVLLNGGKILKIVAETKVIEALKGTERRATIKVEVAIHSCSREPKLAPAQTYYLAGAIGKDGIFHGEWKTHELELK